MKKITLKTGVLLFVLSASFAKAQNIDLVSPAKDLSAQIKAIFPYVAVSIFIVCVFSQLGHFVKENGDWKKGVTNIVIFAAIIGAIVGLVRYVANLSI